MAPADPRPAEAKKTAEAAADLRAQREKVVRQALADLEKRFGRGTVMRLGDKPVEKVASIPTGSLTLDVAIGVGGIPRGRVTEIFGGESSGKTTLSLQVIANAQRAGGIAAFIDAEHAFDPGYAKKLGVDLANLLISQPSSGEEALEIAEALIRSHGVDVVVIDSVAALVPKAELEGEMGDAHVGLQARLMSQALRKLTAVIHLSNTSMIFINQTREKIGTFGHGTPLTTSGGRALKFYASLRIDMARIQTLKRGEEAIGHRVKANVVKNKVAPPFRKGEFDILYGKGISSTGEILDAAIDAELVEKSGTWISWNGKQLGQGRDAAVTFLDATPDIRAALEAPVRERLFATEPEPELKKEVA
ncbi:MAG: recombinase RecA [Planctomycetota bacterium]